MNEKGRMEHSPPLDQFLLRLHQKNNKWLKEDYIRPLLSIGAFCYELVTNRKQALIQLEGKIQNITYSGGSLDLLETMALKEAEVADYDLEQKLALEEEYRGLFIRASCPTISEAATVEADDSDR